MPISTLKILALTVNGNFTILENDYYENGLGLPKTYEFNLKEDLFVVACFNGSERPMALNEIHFDNLNELEKYFINSNLLPSSEIPSKFFHRSGTKFYYALTPII